MLSKNNQKQANLKHINKRQRFGLRKLTVGVASVLLGTTFFMGAQSVVANADAPAAQADQQTEVSANADSSNANKQVVLKSGNQGSAAAINTSVSGQPSQQTDLKTDIGALNSAASSATEDFQSVNDSNKQIVSPNSFKSSVLSANGLANSKIQVNTPIYTGTTDWEPNNVTGKWDGNAADAVYKVADTSTTSTIKYQIQSWNGTNVENSQDFQGKTQYLLMIPAGFEIASTDNTFKNTGLAFSRTDAGLDINIQDLGNVGPNEEKVFLLSLAETPSYSNPLSIMASLKLNPSAGGTYTYNQWSPLLMPINKNINAYGDSSAGGGTGSITLSNGQTYQYIRTYTGSFNSAQWYDKNSEVAYTVAPGLHQMSTNNFQINKISATTNNVSNSSFVGNEQLSMNIQLKGNIHNGDYIDVHLGVPYKDDNGRQAYKLYDTKLSNKPLQVEDGGQVIGKAYNMGTYYRIVFNDKGAALSNPNVQVTLQWGSNRDASRNDNTHSSINDHTSYIYQATNDLSKDRTTFDYFPHDDININGQTSTSGYKIKGTYIYTAKNAGIGNLKTGASSVGSYNRTWDSKGNVSVDTFWYSNTAVSLSTKDLGDEFDIQTTVTKDPTGLVHYTFTSAADMQKKLEDEIATDDTRSLKNSVSSDPNIFVNVQTKAGAKPKVKVEVTFQKIDTGSQLTGKWHVKIVNLDPTTNPDIEFKENSSVNTVEATASGFTMPMGINSYAQDEDNVVNTDTYSGAKTDNEALMNDLKSLPIAGTVFTPYQNGKAGSPSGVYGGKWSAGILYNANGSVTGGGSASDLVTNTLSFEDLATKKAVANSVIFQGATGTTIHFDDAQSAYNGLSGYDFVKAVSVGKDGTETEIKGFDPSQIGSYNFGTANKANPSSYIIYVKKQSIQKAQLRYVDDDDPTNTNMPATVVASGDSGSHIAFQDIAKNINNLIKDHYEFNGVTKDSDKTSLGNKDSSKIDWSTIFGEYDNDNATTQIFTIHFKHETAQASRPKDVKETIHYVMSDGTKAPSDNVQTVHFTESGTTDLVTRKTTWTPADSQSFKEVDSPSVKGYTPDVSTEPSVTVGFGDKDITKTVTYTPVAQKLTVTFIDDVTGKTLKTVTKDGLSNGDSNYNTKDDIDGYLKDHYKLVSDSTNGIDLFFDTDPTVDQSYVVHLTHNTARTSRQKDVKETIHYVMSDGTKAPGDNVQTVHFTESGTTDLVTNNTTWTSSKSQNFKQVDSPSVKGYTPDINSVPVATVNYDSEDINKTVTYSPEDQKLNVKFIDDTTGKVLKTVNKAGLSNADSKYNTKDDIQTYKDKHYQLVSDSTNGQDLIFDDDSATDQAYEVHLKHETTTAVRNRNITETIHYVMADGAKAPKDIVQYLKFTENGVTDLVTGHTSWTPANNQIFAKVVSPAIQGYTVDIAFVPTTTVNYDSKDIIKTVYYTPTSQKLNVHFIDDTTGKVLKTINKAGLTNADSKYNTKSDIQVYDSQHYQLVSDSTNGQDLIFDADPAIDQTYEVHLKHGTEVTNRGKTVTETVHYVMVDGTTSPKDNVQSLKFTESGIRDLVTGDTAWTNAKNQSFKQVDSPDIKGYTADTAFIPSITANFNSNNIIKTVTYTPQSQKLSVKFIDDTTGKVLKTISKDGLSNADSKYNTKSDIQMYKNQHYQLVSDSTNGQELIFDDDPAVDQTYEVHFKHGIQPTSRSRAVTETIHYVFSNGSKAYNSNVQTLHFTQHGTNDQVTGHTTWLPVASQTFETVASPVIDGYDADQSSIPSQTVGYDSNDLNFTVTYTTQPIKPSTPVQPTKPSTPSQPTTPSQPSQPSMPSQPSQPSTPSKPSQPTQPSTLSQPSQPSEPSQPTQPSEPTTPSQPSQPTQPSTPSQPSQSSMPTQPTNPSTTVHPLNPDNPNANNSNDRLHHHEPGQPQHPGSNYDNGLIPGETGQPVQHGNHANGEGQLEGSTRTSTKMFGNDAANQENASSAQGQRQARLPQTGNDRAVAALTGAGFISALAAMILGKKRKQD